MRASEVRTCPTVSTHETTVSVPTSIVPFANTGTISIQCYGSPEISDGLTPAGTVNGYCNFTVSQTMRVEIPIVFGANVLTGETYVECGGTTSTNDEECECNLQPTQE